MTLSHMDVPRRSCRLHSAFAIVGLIIKRMPNGNEKNNKALLEQLIITILGWPWFEYVAVGWKLAHKLWRGMVDEGLYEALEYETTLELKDEQGVDAQFSKRQKVKYLQNSIIAYQDQAWGDGEILLDYSCSPGIEVDRYRPGHKTHILISLREMKKKGDLDEFHIAWGIRNGFLRSTEQWGTTISHRTNYLKIHIIFPKTRPPLRTWLIEEMRQRRHRLQETKLPDGRWLVQWNTRRPRLHEQYILGWEW